jgi:photosynthetic reaction center cytochrome c subunit
MEQNYQHGELKTRFTHTRIPEPIPAAEPAPPGELPWQNVQVLNDVSVSEFLRTMTVMAEWVGGAQDACAFCHNPDQPWSDTMPNGTVLYRKLVARRMLQMTRQINGQYATHVANTGVTCYTCHLGKALPNGMWTYDQSSQYLRQYLDREGVRVTSLDMHPSNANRSSVKQAEWTYALMIGMSQSLGVNCTYCHNTRQFSSWTEAPPARVKAFHAIGMLRDVNRNYLSPLQPIVPAGRLGPMGDAPKIQCVTCHNGTYRPLFGAPMAKLYPALWGRDEWNGVPRPGTRGVGGDATAAPIATVASIPTP